MISQSIYGLIIILCINWRNNAVAIQKRATKFQEGLWCPACVEMYKSILVNVQSYFA